MKYWEHTNNDASVSMIRVFGLGEISIESNECYESTYHHSYNKFAQMSGYLYNKKQLDHNVEKQNTISNYTDTIGDGNISSSKNSPEVLTHIDRQGSANMVDVGSKDTTRRMARAVAVVNIGEIAYKLVANNQISKGNVMTVAQIAGILAAKRTSDLIPLCHPVQLNKVDIKCQLSDEDTNKIRIESVVICDGKTGVEMEALTGASIAALTIYDMCKAVNKSIIIEGIQLEEKTGGKSYYIRSN